VAIKKRMSIALSVFILFSAMISPLIYSSLNSPEGHWVTIRIIEHDLNGDSNPEIVSLKALGLSELQGKFAMDDDWQIWQLTVTSGREEEILFYEETCGYMDIFISLPKDNEFPSIFLVFDNWEDLYINKFTYSPVSNEYKMEELLSVTKRRAW